MGWLGRGIGDFGSQVGQGYDIAQDWKARAQKMAFDAAKQKQDALMAPLQLAELQQRVNQMGKPQGMGVEKLPGGGLGGVTFDPKTGTYSIQNLVPGAPPEPKFASLQQAAAYYLQKGDMEKLKAVNDEIDRTKAQKVVPPPKDAFELWRAQNPNASVADWLKLQEKYKKGPTGSGGPGDVDALAYDIAAGRGTMPTGKFGAAVAQRMKELGLEPPVKNQAEVMRAADVAKKSYMAQQSVDRIMKNPNLTPTDALTVAGIYDKLKGTHVAADWKTRLDSTFSFRPSKKEIAELAEEIKNSAEDSRQQAIDAYKYAGMPVPPALTAGDLSDLGDPVK